MRDRLTSMSKFLSLVLRHQPELVGLTLEAGGWVSVDELLVAFTAHGRELNRAELTELVAQSDKQRFALNADGSKIRANQGHSVQVDLGYPPSAPPLVLYHGTVERFLPAIRQQGLLKGERHHVHLSPTPELATLVGKRRGNPIVLEVAAGEMSRQGYEFFCSPNGVWLTQQVPPQFLKPV